MATGTQVPFTDVGGSPCCCTSNCFDATGSSVPPYATNISPVPLADSWFNITDAEYDALKAGGNYTFDFSMFLQSFRDASTGCVIGGVTNRVILRPYRERSCAVTDLPFTLVNPVVVSGQPSAEDTNCMRLMQNSTINVTEYGYRAATACTAYSENTRVLTNNTLRFSRVLGKSGTQSKLSCCSHRNTNSSPGWQEWFFQDATNFLYGSFSAPWIYLMSGNVNGTIANQAGTFAGYPFMLPAPSTTAVVQIQINGGTPYTIPNTFLLSSPLNSGMYTQFVNLSTILCGVLQCAGRFTNGSVNMLVKFTTSPP